MPKNIYIKNSIKWNLLSAMIGLIVSLLAALTSVQIYSQKGILEGELNNRIDLIKGNLYGQGKRLSDDIAFQVEDALASFNLLASMSHEIRTPMNAIIGMADLLWESPLTAEQAEYVKVFRSAGDNLLQIINDILDLSKVESGHIRLENIHFDLAELVERTCEVLALRAHEKGLELICHLAPDVPTSLSGDPVRLRQILINLIGNAIKFTEKGEVVVRVRNDMVSGQKGALLFSVSDTGIGIPKEKQCIIFESFSQVDASTTRKYGGAEGLEALILAKKAGEPYKPLFLDNRMSEMDGFQVVEYIKNDPELVNVIIMMLTSDNRSGDVTRAKELVA